MPKPKFTDDLPTLSRDPQDIVEDCVWYYEERKGICVVLDSGYANGVGLQFTIPWRKLVATMRRYEKSKQLTPKRKRGAK